MQECITETSETLVTCKPRIEQAIDDLENIMATYQEEDAERFDLLKETEEWKAAEVMVVEAKAFAEAIEI